MYGYYAGDNERNDYEVIEQIDNTNMEILEQNTNLARAPSVDFNHKMMKKKHTSQIDLDKVRREAKELLEVKGPAPSAEDKLMFKKQSVSLLRMYNHLFESIDWLFLVLALIGSIGAGISMPIMSYTMSDVYSDVGNTSEMQNSPEAIAMMREAVEDSMDDQIKSNLFMEQYPSFAIS